jgi:quercetin dioxygenase-like cupin family protein
MPPGASEARHSHRVARQFFYVLEGRLQLEIAGDVHNLEAGTGIEVLAGDAHQAINASSEPVTFLVISHPHAHGDRVDAPLERGAN